MTYRAQLQGPSGRVVHGPFPIRLGGVAGGLMAVGLAALFVLMAFDDARLTCDRATDRCVYQSSRVFERRRHFALSALKGVSVDIVKSGKNGQRGVPQLQLKDRAARLKHVSVREAHKFEAALNRALASEQSTIDLQLRGERWTALIGLGFFGTGLWLLIASLRGIGRIVYQRPESMHGGVLQATHSVFGVPLRRWSLDAHDAARVEVQWSRIREVWHRNDTPGTTAGRLLLHTRSGARHPLSEQAFRGYHLHLRAQEQLHTLLDLPPLSKDTAARLASEAEAMRPPPMMGGGWGAVIGVGWAGACCGMLVGIAVMGVVGVAAGAFRAGDSIPEWVILFGAAGGAIGGILVALWLRKRVLSR